MPRRLPACLLLFVIALWAAPENFDGAGVTVTMTGSALLHRAPVRYPAEARLKSVQGTVMVEVALDAKGEVADARVLSGPVELRRSVLESVFQWHFAPDTANTTRQIQIQFDLPPERPHAPAPEFIPSLVVLQQAPAGPIGRRVETIEILGIPPEARAQLLARLPLHEGDILTQELANATGAAVREFDEHMNLGFGGGSNGGTKLQIVAPGYNWATPPPPVRSATPGRVQVSSAIMRDKLKSGPQPDYPPLAREAAIEGVVKFQAVVGKDGRVQTLTLLSGHPLLVPAALSAVHQWTYEPLTLNGSPTEMESEVDVNFFLPPK